MNTPTKTPLKDDGNAKSTKSVDGVNFQTAEPKPVEVAAPASTNERSNTVLDATILAMDRPAAEVGNAFDAYMDQLEEELSDKVDAGEIDEDRKREIIAFAQANDPRKTATPAVTLPTGAPRVRHISEIDPSYNGKPDSIVVSSGNHTASVKL